MQDYRTFHNRIEHQNIVTALETGRVRFDGFDAKKMRFYESVLSQSNGYMGIRGNFEERYSADHLQGTYLAGVWHPDKTRVGWWKNGYPDFFGKVINTVNYIGIRVIVGGEEIDAGVQSVEMFDYALDLNTAVLTRCMVVNTICGRVRVQSTRFLSIEKQQIAAIRYAVTPLDKSCDVLLIPYLDFHVHNEDSNYNETFWEPGAGEAAKAGGFVTASTRKNPFGKPRFDVCAAMRVKSELAAQNTLFEISSGYISMAMQYHCNTNQTAQIEKIIAVTTSRDSEDIRANAKQAVNEAAELGFDALNAAHCEKMAALLATSSVELEGDPLAEQGIRYNLLQLLCTYRGQDSRLNIGPKGFSGEKYGGAAYWDTEAFLIPFYLGVADPDVAKNLLMFRYHTLEQAKENASKLGLSGALYPMVTFDGYECHNEWEITFEEIHRNGAIAYAIFNYVTYTGDTDFLIRYGFEMLLELSRFWVSRAHECERSKTYVIHGVTGPNEYENNVNNNWYTNRIAKWTLEYTVSIANTYQGELPVRCGSEEIERFSAISERILQPYDSERQIFVQHDSFLGKALVPATSIDPAQRPISRHWSWDRILRSCFVKQADVLQGMFFLEDIFNVDVIRRNFEFYEPMTVHESSLSAGVHAVIAAWTGHLDQAWELMLRAVRLDLDDINQDTCDGLHVTAMSGGWLAMVKGFAGMKTAPGTLRFAPVLPKQLRKYRFTIQYRSRLIRVCVDVSGVTLTLQQGEALLVMLYEREYRLETALHVPLQTTAQHRRTRALIFDLDGVLTDTARLHYEAWKTLAKEEWGFSFTEEMNEQFKGVERRTCMRMLARMAGLVMQEEQVAAYAEQKNAYYRKLLEDLTPANLMPQTRNLLSACREQGLRTAVASASRNTKDILKRTGIYDLFDTVVDGNEVQNPKPDSECFLKAAMRLGLKPQECLVLEDSNQAITTAVQAGFSCVGVGPKVLEHTIYHLQNVSELDFSRIP